MNKTEFVDQIANNAGMPKKDAERFLNSFVNTATTALNKGEKIQLVGFGTFEVKERAERKGRNPKTGEEITIPASKSPSFKAGKALKDTVNNK